MLKQEFYRRDFKSPRDFDLESSRGVLPCPNLAEEVLRRQSGDGDAGGRRESSKIVKGVTGDDDGDSDEDLACRRLR